MSHDLRTDLANNLRQRLAERARTAFARPDQDEAISWSQECDLQWQVARLSRLPSTAEKADALAQRVRALAAAMKRRHAARFLALAVRHSRVNELPPHEGSLAPAFAKAEIKGAILGIMAGAAWDIASHRSFRRYLSTRENRAINLMIASANYHSAVEQLRAIDVYEEGAFDKMLAAVQATGQSETIFDAIFNDMVERARYLPKGNSN
jgi:hypothetical protein